MKKNIFVLFAILAIAVSCKEEAKTTSTSEEKTTEVNKVEGSTKNGEVLLRGEFIYTADAAVLKGNNFIYGVELNDMTTELAKKVKPYQREDFDMVPVAVKAVVKKNPNEEGWDEVIEIKEIIKVSKPTDEPAIKVKGEQK
jgi:predicted methyltransferase